MTTPAGAFADVDLQLAAVDVKSSSGHGSQSGPIIDDSAIELQNRSDRRRKTGGSCRKGDDFLFWQPVNVNDLTYGTPRSWYACSIRVQGIVG